MNSIKITISPLFPQLVVFLSFSVMNSMKRNVFYLGYCQDEDPYGLYNRIPRDEDPYGLYNRIPRTEPLLFLRLLVVVIVVLQYGEFRKLRNFAHAMKTL